MPRGASGPPMAVEMRGCGRGSPQARGSGLVADREFADAAGSSVGVTLAQNREGVSPSGPIGGRGRALGGDEAEPAELASAEMRRGGRPARLGRRRPLRRGDLAGCPRWRHRGQRRRSRTRRGAGCAGDAARGERRRRKAGAMHSEGPATRQSPVGGGRETGEWPEPTLPRTRAS